jgi:uncharacterized membrane protein YfcA
VGLTQKQFVASLHLYFGMGGLLVVSVYAMQGLLTEVVRGYILWALPAMVAGFLVGIRLLHVVSAALLKKVTDWMIPVLGLVLLINVGLAFLKG